MDRRSFLAFFAALFVPKPQSVPRDSGLREQLSRAFPDACSLAKIRAIRARARAIMDSSAYTRAYAEAVQKNLIA